MCRGGLGAFLEKVVKHDLCEKATFQQCYGLKFVRWNPDTPIPEDETLFRIQVIADVERKQNYRGRTISVKTGPATEPSLISLRKTKTETETLPKPGYQTLVSTTVRQYISLI